MSVFQPCFVICDDNSVISLRFVESIKFDRADDDLLADKLKGDAIIEMRTISGKDCSISVLKQISVLGKQYKLSTNVHEVRDAIFERWISFNT